jgi:UDP-GlcNAc3NAcA epimerase
MKIVTVIGARPQFIKAATISRQIALNNNITEIIVHTGQHYHANMSDVFFKELDLPKPDHHLNIGGNTHGKMTGRQIEAIETILLATKPDWVLVYGDTNSTLSGALAAAKLHIPVAHVEAGLRSFNRKMPEEINRILTDHIATLLFAPSQNAIDNLHHEGFSENRIYSVGDVMYDAALYYRDRSRQPPLDITPNKYILATLHRAENVDDAVHLQSIFDGLSHSHYPVILPLHPRTKDKITKLAITVPDIVLCIKPVSYLEMIWLQANANAIATDSGGIQKEAYFFNTPCITFRDETEWVETVAVNANVLVGANTEKIRAALNQLNVTPQDHALYGDGTAAKKIVNIITKKSIGV